MSGAFNFTNANNRQALEIGSRFLRSLTFEDSTGTGIDITGYTFQMQVRKRVGGTLVLEASTSNGRITITTALDGEFDIDIPSSVTDLLAAATYKYDLEYTIGGEVTRLMEGDIEVTSQITT